MYTFIIGSCRVKRFRMFISDSEIKKSIGICQHHVHNPFEIEQLLNWIVSGDFSEAELFYNFHNSISTEKIKLPDDYYTNVKKSFEMADRIYIEISGLKRFNLKVNEKKYECNQTAIEYLQKNKSTLVDQVETQISTPDDIFVSLANIREIVKHKQLIVVPHYSWKTGDKAMESRDLLRKYVVEGCRALNIPIVDPDACISKLGKNLACIDSSHYTIRFEKLIALFYSKGFV
jgi:hypothetical protein